MGKKKKKVVLNEKAEFDNPFAALKESLDLPDTGIDISEVEEDEPPFDRTTLKFRLRKERKNRSGKTVTVIDGAHEVPEDLREDLQKYLKKALGVGAFWEGEVLVVQGDIAERLETALAGWKAEQS